ncbi:MAG: electron transfer flavoprotein subunit alpha/FixB family protein [Syntrophales bacterium]|nr:electron transfer flavoprotein subunit alpha/FixB family protein [Syntrophales bacterium]
MAETQSECKLWVFVEQRKGKPAEVGIELLGKALNLAEDIGWKVGAVLLGHQVEKLADEILSYGVHEVIVADASGLAEYHNLAYVKVLERAIREHEPEVFLLGATTMGTDLGPRLAARLRTGLSAHCIDLELNDTGELLAVIPWSGGNSLGRISCPRTRPQMATINPGIFDMPPPGTVRGRIIYINGAVDQSDFGYRIVETHHQEAKPGDLETAEVIVVGGYGVGREENWHHIEDLAAMLHGAVGATRPPVDEGWAEGNQMVGQSGRTVYPRLYIGIGISGHMHHLVGIKKADLMVAINQDPNAAIFAHCDLGLVGDLKDIVPSLIESLKGYSQ